ncbi:hypothetical protein [Streptomyces termitum]|uniref:hypothetical protein n=1 Tax=Streptomyces termitum TaxID=67368 RepID=UPI0033BDE388
MSALSGFAAALPAPGALRARLRVLALLEAVFEPRWPRYGHAPADGGGFEHFWYENGGGDDHHVFLGASTAFLRAFDHESWMSPYSEDELCPGLLDGLPEECAPLTRLENDEEEFPALARHFGGYCSRPVDAGVPEALMSGVPVDRDLVERLAPRHHLAARRGTRPPPGRPAAQKSP